MRTERLVPLGLGIVFSLLLIVGLSAIASAPDSPAGTRTGGDAVPGSTEPLTPEAHTDVNAAVDNGSGAADELTPDFDYVQSGADGGAVLFKNSTTGGTLPHAYAWDFNGDGVADSTETNPSYTFPASGQYKVTLTVTSSASERKAVTKAVDAFTLPAPVPELPTLILMGSGIAALAGLVWLGKRRNDSRTAVA